MAPATRGVLYFTARAVVAPAREVGYRQRKEPRGGGTPGAGSFGSDRMNLGMKRMAVAAAVLAALVSALAGCSRNGGETKRKTAPAELTILFSSDLLGRIRSCGCTVEDVGVLGRRAAYTKRIRSAAKNLLGLDAGDAFSLDM